jgi:toxin ParE1/3/4
MAEVVWTEPALSDLDAIADYIALHNETAARNLVRAVFKHVEQLTHHPKSGSRPPELKAKRYRQIIQPLCRVFYRQDKKSIYVLYVMRAERRLRPSRLTVRAKKTLG